MRKKLLFSITLIIGCTAAVQADWPGFRGPGHQGIAGAGDFPVRWGREENVAWKVKLPGPGASSPVVKGDRVFVTCFTGKKGPEIVRYLLCFDAKSGKQLWELQRPALQPESDYTGQNTQHGFATGTPIVEGERIYVNFCRGGVFAFDLDGKELWHRELGVFRNGFGSGSSPSIHGDLLLVNATVEASAFFALNKNTGETLWRAKLVGDCWSTPVVVETANGQKEIVLNAAAGLFGFDPDNGKELWRCDTVGGNASSTPVVRKDILYVIGSTFGGKAAAAIRAGGRGDVTKTHVVWSNPKVGASYCSPLLIGERLYFFSNLATCLNAATGKVIAQNRLDGVTQLYSSPIVAGGKIYLFTRNEGAYVLSADDKMSVLSHNDLGDTSTINASPAASDAALFIRSQEYLYCLRKPVSQK
jgi:outer membrane protein assembly factor BamB